MHKRLWAYAQAWYELPEVAKACLTLQDLAGVNVNMLLTAAWLATGNYRWSRAQVRESEDSCADWQHNFVLPQRQIRRYLKAVRALSELYQKALELELLAEKAQLLLLEGLATRWVPETTPVQPLELFRYNLDCYLEGTAADADPACKAARDDLLLWFNAPVSSKFD